MIDLAMLRCLVLGPAEPSLENAEHPNHQSHRPNNRRLRSGPPHDMSTPQCPRRPLAPVPRRGRRRDQRFPKRKLRFAWIVALDQGGLKSRKDAAWTAVSFDVLSNDPAQSRWRWGRWPSAGVSGRESSSLHARDALIGQKAAPKWQQVDCCWSNTRAAATDQSRDLLSPRQLNGRCINRSTWGVCLQVLGQHLLTAHMQMVHTMFEAGVWVNRARAEEAYSSYKDRGSIHVCASM